MPRWRGPSPSAPRFYCLNCASFPVSLPAAPGRRQGAFPLSCFMLVGCHGLHIPAGLPLASDDDGADFRQGMESGHPAVDFCVSARLACPRHRLGRHLYGRLSNWQCKTSAIRTTMSLAADTAPGVKHRLGWRHRVGLAQLVVIGLRLWRRCSRSPPSLCRRAPFVWGPGIPAGSGPATSPSPRWVCTSSFSCTSRPRPTTRTTSWRSPSAC